MTSTPRKLDPVWHAAIGQFTGGLSPAALATAYVDWALHLIGSPDKQTALIRQAMTLTPDDVAPDLRFADPAWQAFPYSLWVSQFLAQQAWWDTATTALPGVDPKHARIMQFTVRQILDMMAPSNYFLTNPQAINQTWQEQGQNLLRGTRYFIEDFNRLITAKSRRTSSLQVGKDLATTPGDVVLRNRLVELIRYRPTTEKVRPEPILIVPAWIMKYYILNLTDQRSLVAYLRDQGFEVYIMSWKNPDNTDADLGLQDYIDLGLRTALDYIRTDGPPAIHAVGYCLGGTLLTATAAALARDNDTILRTVSLLAAQVDFSKPGELGLFIGESQVAFLQDVMTNRGYLKADQMAGAFQLLRSNDLIWSRVVRHYLLGERTPDNPLLAWNADATRMPAKMHSDYLRHMFLQNDLAKARFPVDGKPVALTDIRAPIYTVATEADHVSPWTSVYRITLLTDTDVTFVLTNGGHNGGILSEPGHPHRHFRHGHKTEGAPHIAAQSWNEQHSPQDGSWWPHWANWLHQHSSAAITPRRKTGENMQSAPGHYVFG